MRRTRTLSTALPLAGVLLAFTLAGCTASELATEPAPRNAVSTQAALTPTRTPLPSLSDLPIGTLIASGKFDDRGTTGRIEIRASGGDRGFEISLVDMSPVPAVGTSLELNSLPANAGEWDLGEAFSYYRYDPLEQTAEQTFTTPSAGYGGFETNDPTYMRSAVIWGPISGANIGLGSVVATAPLTWDLPNMNPGLLVVDNGYADGAHGSVSAAADGSPASYRIAAGDTPDGITSRFGITENELEWLNPDRDPNNLYDADAIINLSRENRGIREH